MGIYSLISNTNNMKKLKIGLVAVNNKNEVLLIKENLERINKDIYNLPTVDTNYLDENSIINEFNKKYNLKIDKLYGYVNEVKILDDKCDIVEQINLYAKINDNMYDFDNNVLKDLYAIEEDEQISEILKNTLEIFMYNENV